MEESSEEPNVEPNTFEKGIENIIQQSKAITFSKEDIKKVLLSLTVSMENETDKMALETDFTVKDNKIAFVFPNLLLSEKLEEFKARIHEAVSKASERNDWEIVTEVLVEEVKTKVYKTQDKFEAMKTKNPMLNTFKEALNLDLDF